MARKRNERRLIELENLGPEDFIFTNFSKDPDLNYGVRSFNIFIPDDMVPSLREEGWNVKPLEDRDTGEVEYILPIEVRFDKYPPDIYIFGSETKVRTKIDEDCCGDLDSIVKNSLVSADISISPSYRKDGSGMIKAYLDGLWIVYKERRADVKFSKFINEQPEDEETPF